jgi:hypothetical protein
MSDQPRPSRVVSMTPGEPRVPEPHPADYSNNIPDSVLDLIDERCNQNELSSGRTIQRFEW